jgi:hypothetical protein
MSQQKFQGRRVFIIAGKSIASAQNRSAMLELIFSSKCRRNDTHDASGLVEQVHVFV